MVKEKCPKVSVLVPCYNSERYIDECITSIINQSLKDIEVICINDGSTDNTLDIIKKYADLDSRVLVIDKPNEGYGKTMNRGLNIASGEYIAIVECDDWIEKNALELLYTTAKQNDADMVKADFVLFDNDTRVETPSRCFGVSPKMYGKVFCPMTDNSDVAWTGHPSIWTCLYRNDMIQKYKIRFAETPGASFQDMGFKPKTFIAARSFVYIPNVILHYRKHANNSDKTNSKIFEVCEVHNDADRWLQQSGLESKRAWDILNVSRFSNYVWNLRRLSGDAKAQFTQRFQSDFDKILSAGKLNRNFFNDKLWLKVCIMVYPNNPWWRILRTLTTLIWPIYRNKVVFGHKVYYLFGGIVLRKVKV
ncbi:MAG: glycosyltransferase family 2 protein [Alphaproteobacteria bacterium]|nr:glycosyltransferase family 2 protein [Alphaproteobacteria bacterium]